MRNAPAFQFYVKDWLADTNVQLMSAVERGCYIQLLACCWENDGLPQDLEDLAALCKVDAGEFVQLWNKRLQKCFMLVARADGERVFYNRRQYNNKTTRDAEIKDVDPVKSAAATKRWELQRAAEAARSKMQPACTADAQSMQSDAEPYAHLHAEAMQIDADLHAQSDAPRMQPACTSDSNVDALMHASCIPTRTHAHERAAGADAVAEANEDAEEERGAGEGNTPAPMHKRSRAAADPLGHDDARFSAWYAAYPRPQNRRDAYKCWLRLVTSDARADQIERGTRAQIAGEWRGRPKDKIPYPATWINSLQWLEMDAEPDELPQETTISTAEEHLPQLDPIPEKAWRDAIYAVSQGLDEEYVNEWIKPLRPIGFATDTAYIEAPTAIARSILNDTLGPQLCEALRFDCIRILVAREENAA